MNKIVLGVSVGVAAVAAVACSSGSKSGGKSVSSGTYTESTGGFSSDQCGFSANGSSNYDASVGGVAGATVTKPGSDGTNSMDFEADDNTGSPLYDETYDINGSALSDPNSPGVQTFDCSAMAGTSGTYNCATKNPYNCSLTLDIEYQGVITGANKFTVNDSFTYDNSTGATACPAAVLTSAQAGAGLAALPCTTVDSGSFHK